MVVIKHKGSLSKTTKFLTNAQKLNIKKILDKYGKIGVRALSNATPVDTGKTAASWSYRITMRGNVIKLIFFNSNNVNGVPIAIIIQYGHATRSGAYVQGRDYINPVTRPIFDMIEDEVWREVENA